MLALQPLARRLVYVTIYEILAIVLSTILLMMMNGGDASGSLPVAVAVSLIALVWNFVYNSGFEWTERRCGCTTRTLTIRVAHACGFEIGLFLFTIPLYMVWYGVDLWTATVMEAAILIFFFVYTFLFTWAFDALVKTATPNAPASTPLQQPNRAK